MRNIICSVGKGEMPMDKCLDCSKLNPQCGFSYPLLKGLYAHDESPQRSVEIHVSDLTGCLRRAYYSKKFPVSETPHSMIARTIGTFIHNAIENHMQGEEDIVSEMPVAYNGVVGKVDLYDKKTGVISDLKTTRWIIPAKLPYASHSIQVNMYAYMMKQLGYKVTGMNIQYLDVSGATKCRRCKVVAQWYKGELRCPNCFELLTNAHLGAVIIDVDYDPSVPALFEQKRKELKTCLEMEALPDAEPSYLCEYCLHTEMCNKN